MTCKFGIKVFIIPWYYHQANVQDDCGNTSIKFFILISEITYLRSDLTS